MRVIQMLEITRTMPLSIDATISLASTVVTILSMGITLIAALRVKKTKDQISLDIRRLNLTNSSRSLERTLVEVRKLLVEPVSSARGRGRVSLIDSIQAQFDSVLMQIDLDGPDADVRGLVVEAQARLLCLRSKSDQEICNRLTSELQSFVQDSVSRLNGRYLRLEGKSQ